MLSEEEILKWNRKYDLDHPWWVSKEKELGNKFRKTKTLTKQDLLEIVDWKFKELIGRRVRISKLVENNDAEDVSKTCAEVFSQTPIEDNQRISNLDRLEGVGPALASVILTFYDPKHYGIHDIHVWREFFGPEPPTIFIGTSCYLRLLAELRGTANRFNLEARTVEKAYFKKNLDESKQSDNSETASKEQAGGKCPTCGFPLVWRTASRNGETYRGCTNYDGGCRWNDRSY